MLPLINSTILLYSTEVRANFAMWCVHLYGEKLVFSVTAWYVVHMLKLLGHYAAFDKFYNMDCSGIES